MLADDPAPRYCDDFYEEAGTAAERAAVELVPMLIELMEPASVVDVGCGVGSFIDEFVRNGVSDVLGIEGPDFPADHYRGPRESLVILDLEQPAELDRRFDVALCLEVAEHLPYGRSAGLVRDLTRLADVIVFSAAIPGQGGTHHVNEQWPTFWQDHFARHGFEGYDVLRPRVWNNASIPWWYRQNVVVFARPDALERRLESAPLRSVVHPVHYDSIRARLDAREREAAERRQVEIAVEPMVSVERLDDQVECLRQLLAATRLVAERAPAPEVHARSLAIQSPARREETPLDEPFDAAWYLSMNPDISVDPKRHYQDVGWREHRQPHPLFDTAWYLATNPDVAAASVDPFHHYVTTGWEEGRDPHPLFDTDWYISEYPEVTASGLNPLDHFVRYGWREGRRPHPRFDTAGYLTANPDVATAGVNPLTHYVIHGVLEGRPLS